MKKRGSAIYKKTVIFLKNRPMMSFFISLGLLLLILLVGQFLQPKTQELQKETAAKKVKVFSIGDAPKATFQAKIEKAGVIKIMAQTPGVVQNITVQEGEKVGKGQRIISLSSNYQGGNASSMQRQMAQVQYQNVLDTFDAQKNLIQKQRDIADKSKEQAEKMREISRKSLDETNALIASNQTLLDQMKQIASPTDLVMQGSINQLQGGINQLREAGRSIDYTSSNDNAPAKLADLQKETAIKQLDLQEKSLTLNKEVSRLQVSLAYINEAMMYPASPFSGTVERVYVNKGQLVNPGTVLATVTANKVSATAILTVPEKIAKILTKGVPSELIINDKKIAVTPYYISSQATDGQLFSVFYDVPEAYQADVTDEEYIGITVPVNPVKTTATDPFVPVDAIYQSQEEAFVLVFNKGKAQTRVVKVGKVYGSYVEVLSGISSGDQIILDRNVVAQDKVTIN